jgi:hypothetical protein
MGAAREPDQAVCLVQADFDLERFIDMFDEAMSSQDPRVIDALRNLLMIVTLTRPEVRATHGRNSGPLRRLFEDMHHLNRRLYDIEDTIRRVSSPREEKAYQANIAMKASQDIAQHIDQDLINTLKIKAQGLYHK